jgi:hypothetical protein
MSNQLESRFITYPDILEKSPNHTVLLIDADLDDVANLATFCSVSHQNYDIYLYKGTTGDLEWLSHLSSRLDKTFIRDGSTVRATSADCYTTVTDLKDYFTKIDS